MDRQTAAAVLQDLLQALRAEQQALAAGRADALPALADAKAQAFDRLAPALREAAAGEHSALAADLAAARRINAVNAALVASHMAVHRARLDTLLAHAGSSAGVYGRHGKLAPPPALRPGAA